jgi:predicted DNA-binding transcriptional regulator AlpA
LLAPEDVAVRLGVSRKALERWRGTGGGPRFVRFGHKTVRYRVEDVEAFVVERLCVSTAA